MKKLVAILMAGALLMTFGVALAAKEDPADKGEKVYCCHKKGDCDKSHSKAVCEKEGGKVVPSCKECK